MRKIALLSLAFFLVPFLSAISLVAFSTDSSAAVDVSVFNDVFERKIGKPRHEHNVFPGVEGPATVKIYNGDGGKWLDRATVANVIINGKVIFRASDFNKKVKYLEKQVNLIDGENSIDLNLLGMPGVKLRVEIIQGIQAEAAAVIGPEGGTISVNQINSPIFGVKIEIPERVLETNTLVKIAVPSEPYDIPDNLEAAGSAVDFLPNGLLFSGPIYITLKYSDTDNDGFIDGTNIKEDDAIVAYFNLDTQIDFMNILGRDKINKEIKIETDHFSAYQVVGNKTCKYMKWGMEVQKENASDDGWVEENQWGEPPDKEPYTPPSPQFAFNYKWDNLSVLDIWTLPGTEQRIKLKRGEGPVFGNGIYEWKVFVPVDEGNDDGTSIGAFIYHDEYHEFDFEITYGTESEREEYGAIYSWQKLCYMTSQKKDGPDYRRKVIPIEGDRWYRFKISVEKIGEQTKVSWFINDVLKFGPEYVDFYNIKYQLYCSVENIKSFGDHLPNYVNHGYFDYVSFTDYDNCNDSSNLYFYDNFNSENGGVATNNYSSFTNWNVASGSVDLGGPNGGDGMFVDLDGTTGQNGTLTSKQNFVFESGKIYTLSFSLAASPNISASTVYVQVASGALLNEAITRYTQVLYGDPIFADYSYTFSGNGTSGRLSFTDGGGGGNTGMYLDNVKLVVNNP